MEKEEIGSSAKLGSSAKTARNQGRFGRMVNQSSFKRVEKYKMAQRIKFNSVGYLLRIYDGRKQENKGGLETISYVQLFSL